LESSSRLGLIPFNSSSDDIPENFPGIIEYFICLLSVITGVGDPRRASNSPGKSCFFVCDWSELSAPWG
jgi:hypothetical protein